MAALGTAALCSAMGQFVVTVVIGDVAQEFGQPGAGESLRDQLGLTGTTIGIALAVIRLASMGSLLSTSLADRFGRRPILLVSLGIGLALTLVSVISPGFWWWVAVVACARLWLATTNAVAGVSAAESVSTRHRTWVLAFMAATYAVGTGLVSVPRPLLSGGFRQLTVLAASGLVVLPWLVRRVKEPPIVAQVDTVAQMPGAVPAAHRPNLVRLVALSGGVALATGPGYTYVYLFGEQILGFSQATMSWIVLAAGPVGLTGLLAGRWMADHWGRRAGVAVSLVGVAVGVGASYQTIPALFVLGYMGGLLGGGAIGPGMGAIATEVFPTEIRATVAGWVAAAGVVGAVVGLVAFGVLADSVGFGGAAAVLAGCSTLSVLALHGLPETRTSELDQHVTPVP